MTLEDHIVVLEADRGNLHLRVKELLAEVELWKEIAAALQRDFDATMNAPCPHCGERP